MKPLRSSYPVGHICNPQTPWVRGADVATTIQRARERLREAGIEPKVVRVPFTHLNKEQTQ